MQNLFAIVNILIIIVGLVRVLGFDVNLGVVHADKGRPVGLQAETLDPLPECNSTGRGFFIARNHDFIGRVKSAP